MVRVSVLNDALKTMYNAEKRGKRQVLIRPSSKVVIKFLQADHVLWIRGGSTVSSIGRLLCYWSLKLLYGYVYEILQGWTIFALNSNGKMLGTTGPRVTLLPSCKSRASRVERPKQH
eukprot:scaffold4764_cov52-Prasinocladus_malaysianus.AAC.1